MQKVAVSKLAIDEETDSAIASGRNMFSMLLKQPSRQK